MGRKASRQNTHRQTQTEQTKTRGKETKGDPDSQHERGTSGAADADCDGRGRSRSDERTNSRSRRTRGSEQGREPITLTVLSKTEGLLPALSCSPSLPPDGGGHLNSKRGRCNAERVGTGHECTFLVLQNTCRFFFFVLVVSGKAYDVRVRRGCVRRGVQP